MKKILMFMMIMIFTILLIGCSNDSNSVDNIQSSNGDSIENTKEEVKDNRVDRMTIQEYREMYLSETDDTHIDNDDGYIYVHFGSVLGKSEYDYMADGLKVSDGKIGDNKISSIKLEYHPEYEEVQEYYLDGIIEYINSLMNDGQDYSSLIKEKIEENIINANLRKLEVALGDQDYIRDDSVIMENDKFTLTHTTSISKINQVDYGYDNYVVELFNKIILEHK